LFYDDDRSGYAVFTQSDYWRHGFARAHLARDCDSAYHLSRVNDRAPEFGGRAIIAIVGPTASGKSELGIHLALRLNGEIINCDSVQVYQGIQIATAKVSPSERQGVPHHLIDFVSPHINFTAADWARAALDKITETEARHRTAFLVGGTGFYLRALREPFFTSPPTNECLRGRLTEIRKRRGAEHLHRMLLRFDPDEAQLLSPRDWPRIQRAIEFYLQTGSAISRRRPLRPAPPPLARRLRVIALNPPRAELYRRINERAEQHFANGLVAEVQELLDQGVPAESNALGAHGYRRVVEYLKGGRDLESAIEQTKLDVRHYAKRQLTWFRREQNVHWLEGFGDNPEVQQAALELLQS
jgi:tRNA dimethylallyltransferase